MKEREKVLQSFSTGMSEVKKGREREREGERERERERERRWIKERQNEWKTAKNECKS